MVTVTGCNFLMLRSLLVSSEQDAAARAQDTPVATFDEDFRRFGNVRIENA
jgi:hypothetical protein